MAQITDIQAIQRLIKTQSGSAVLPSNCNFTDVNGGDYEVWVEGDGFVIPDSKTNTGFDFTVRGGTVIFTVHPKVIGGLEAVP